MLKRAYLYTFLSGLLLICLNYKAKAQSGQALIDSLLEALPAAKEDTNKVMLLSEISRAYFQVAPDKGVTYGQHALALANKLEYEYGIMKANFAVGRCYAVQQKLPEALKHFTNALAAARKAGTGEDIGNAHVSLSNVFADKKEYDKALEHLDDAENSYNDAGIANRYFIANGKGNVYLKINDYRAALKYFILAMNMEEAGGNNPGRLATTYQNIGSSYSELNKNDSALIYLFKALNTAKQTGNARTYLFALSNISAAYLNIAEQPGHYAVPDSLKDRKANFLKCILFGKQAVAMSYELSMPLIRVNTYYNMGRAYALLGNYQEAYKYNDLHAVEKDSLKTIDMQVAFAKAEAEYQARVTTDSLKYENKLKDQELSKRHSDRNKLIAIISLIGISGLLVINRQKLKAQQKRKEAEAEKKRVEDLAKQQLGDFTRNMQEKNDLIESISAEMLKLKEQGAAIAPIDEKLLGELQQSILLTDEQWNNFKTNFEKVHPGFIARLKNRLPDLTPAETRFLVLSKLKLSAREMAGMLGITPPAVRASKYRLMKKLGFEDDTLLDELIEHI